MSLFDLIYHKCNSFELTIVKTTVCSAYFILDKCKGTKELSIVFFQLTVVKLHYRKNDC